MRLAPFPQNVALDTLDAARSLANALSTCAPATRLIWGEEETAAAMDLSRRTLQRMRLAGEGPPHVKLTPNGSRIGYVPEVVRQWLAARSGCDTTGRTAA